MYHYQKLEVYFKQHLNLYFEMQTKWDDLIRQAINPIKINKRNNSYLEISSNLMKKQTYQPQNKPTREAIIISLLQDQNEPNEHVLIQTEPELEATQKWKNIYPHLYQLPNIHKDLKQPTQKNKNNPFTAISSLTQKPLNLLNKNQCIQRPIQAEDDEIHQKTWFDLFQSSLEAQSNSGDNDPISSSEQSSKINCQIPSIDIPPKENHLLNFILKKITFSQNLQTKQLQKEGGNQLIVENKHLFIQNSNNCQNNQYKQIKEPIRQNQQFIIELKPQLLHQIQKNRNHKQECLTTSNKQQTLLKFDGQKRIHQKKSKTQFLLKQNPIPQIISNNRQTLTLQQLDLEQIQIEENQINASESISMGKITKFKNHGRKQRKIQKQFQSCIKIKKERKTSKFSSQQSENQFEYQWILGNIKCWKSLPSILLEGFDIFIKQALKYKSAFIKFLPKNQIKVNKIKLKNQTQQRSSIKILAEERKETVNQSRKMIQLKDIFKRVLVGKLVEFQKQKSQDKESSIEFEPEQSNSQFLPQIHELNGMISEVIHKTNSVALKKKLKTKIQAKIPQSRITQFEQRVLKEQKPIDEDVLEELNRIQKCFDFTSHMNSFFGLNKKVPSLSCLNGLGLRSSHRVEIIDKQTFERSIQQFKLKQSPVDITFNRVNSKIEY